MKKMKRGAVRSEEERLLLLHQRVQAEEELMKKEEEMRSFYLQDKLQKEQKHSAVNLLKLRDTWRTRLRPTRVLELRGDVPVLSQTSERKLDELDATIQEVMHKLQEAELQTEQVQRNHLESVEHQCLHQEEHLVHLEELWSEHLEELQTQHGSDREQNRVQTQQDLVRLQEYVLSAEQRHKENMQEIQELDEDLCLSSVDTDKESMTKMEDMEGLGKPKTKVGAYQQDYQDYKDQQDQQDQQDHQDQQDQQEQQDQQDHQDQQDQQDHQDHQDQQDQQDQQDHQDHQDQQDHQDHQDHQDYQDQQDHQDLQDQQDQQSSRDLHQMTNNPAIAIQLKKRITLMEEDAEYRKAEDCVMEQNMAVCTSALVKERLEYSHQLTGGCLATRKLLAELSVQDKNVYKHLQTIIAKSEKLLLAGEMCCKMESRVTVSSSSCLLRDVHRQDVFGFQEILNAALLQREALGNHGDHLNQVNQQTDFLLSQDARLLDGHHWLAPGPRP